MQHGGANNRTLAALRETRLAQLGIANLRIVLGFAFLPAGLKKVLGQPFTDPDKLGVFHEFLHAFHAASPLYRVVGIVQLLGALLLLSQRFATLGAAMLLPVLVAIGALCWSSSGIPTIVTVSLMTAGILLLLAWEMQRWRALFGSEQGGIQIDIVAPVARIDRRLWERCGLAIFVVYMASSAIHGGVYRPRGADFGDPAFYVMPMLMLFPIATWLLDRSRYRASRKIDQG